MAYLDGVWDGHWVYRCIFAWMERARDWRCVDDGGALHISWLAKAEKA